MAANTTLVINSKGGAGKTTVTTNLASFFAARGVPTAILDYDPQGSSLNWLALRGSHQAKIHGASGVPPRTGLRSLAMHIPAEVRQLVIDAPAGVAGVPLQEMLARAQSIVIPVQPSAIDIHATANFIRDLMLAGRARARKLRLAVVANRVRRASPVYQPLERFLASLGLPFLARLADSEVFVEAAETGTGVFEMSEARGVEERAQFMPIIDWVDPRLEPKVIELPRAALRPARLELSQ